MPLLTLFATVQRGHIKDADLVEGADMPEFHLGDVIDGKITVLRETGDPTQPTMDEPIDGSTGVALTDGIGTVFAQASAIAVTGNDLTFTLAVSGTALDTIMAEVTEDYVPAFFEARITQGDQDILLLRDPCVIQKQGQV